MTFSQTAPEGIDNKATPETVQNLKRTAAMLGEVRSLLGDVLQGY